MEEGFRKFPDEDKIERVLDLLYSLAWDGRLVDSDSVGKFKDGFKWVLDIWNKTFASRTLSNILWDNYLAEVRPNEEAHSALQTLDLVACFFHHYIYAFDEFMNRKFRHSVIRCGLICERIVKRLVVASNNPDVLRIVKFEDRVNKIRSLLEGKCSEIDHLALFLGYVYHQRTKKGAHDYPAATALIAKSCITQTPTIYMLYLNALEELGIVIKHKQDLLELVNSTISTGTTLVVSEKGKPVNVEQVLESLYRLGYFASEASMKDIERRLRSLTYSFPSSTLHKALAKLSGKRQMLVKKGKMYVQRLPPSEYYREEIVL